MSGRSRRTQHAATDHLVPTLPFRRPSRPGVSGRWGATSPFATCPCTPRATGLPTDGRSPIGPNKTNADRAWSGNHSRRCSTSAADAKRASIEVQPNQVPAPTGPRPKHQDHLPISRWLPCHPSRNHLPAWRPSSIWPNDPERHDRSTTNAPTRPADEAETAIRRPTGRSRAHRPPIDRHELASSTDGRAPPMPPPESGGHLPRPKELCDDHRQIVASASAR
jgi:hypothetical protein